MNTRLLCTAAPRPHVFSRTRFGALVCLCLFLLFFGAAARFAPSAHAAPKKDLWELWNKSNEANTAVIDHSAWGALLTKYVRYDQARRMYAVRYAAFSKADEAALSQYLAALESITITEYAKKEQLAYWINFYNALTWDLIVRAIREKGADKITSIKKVRSPWDTARAAVRGEALTLNDIEHRILRPIWNDARVHFALNCASVGCPDIAAEPYTAAAMDAMLNRARSRFIENGRGAFVRADGRLVLSSLFNWYAEDFAESLKESLTENLAAENSAGQTAASAGDKKDAVQYVLRYAAPQKRALLQAALSRGAGVLYEYNWDLNSAP